MRAGNILAAIGLPWTGMAAIRFASALEGMESSILHPWTMKKEPAFIRPWTFGASVPLATCLVRID